jgi:hypothetical protein
LEAGDFAGAENALRRVPKNDPASADADLVRKALKQALAPRVTSAASVRSDNLPFDVSSLGFSVSAFASSRVQLTLTGESLTLRGSERLTAGLARASARARVGAALLDLAADAASRYWSDGRKLVLGGASAELFPTGALRIHAGALRDEELGNFASAQWHVYRDTAFVKLEVPDFKRFNLNARAEATLYSDANTALLGYAWLTYSALLDPLRIELGYAGAYRDTQHSRWDNLTGYFPYMTPLQSLRHGPIASLELLLPPAELGAAGSMALIASERDPSTVGYFESRRNTSYYEGRAYLRFGSEHAGIQISYELLQDGFYYTLHTVRLNAHYRL